MSAACLVTLSWITKQYKCHKYNIWLWNALSFPRSDRGAGLGWVRQLPTPPPPMFSYSPGSSSTWGICLLWLDIGTDADRWRHGFGFPRNWFPPDPRQTNYRPGALIRRQTVGNDSSLHNIFRIWVPKVQENWTRTVS